MKKLICLVLFACLAVAASAQEIDWEKKIEKTSPKKLLAEAKEAIRIDEYEYALPILLALDTLMPAELERIYLIGAAYMGLEKEREALPYLMQSTQHPGASQYPDLYFLIGRAFHLEHEFDSAARYYEMHKAAPSQVAHTADNADLYMRQCIVGKEMIKNAKDVQVHNLGPKVNSPYPDYAPVISADETRMIFTSRRPENFGDVDPLTNIHYEDVYIVEKDDDGEWGLPRNMGKNINTETHDASIGLSPDGDILYLYKAVQTNARLAGDIYASEFNQSLGEWSAPNKMPDGINSKYWEPHASINSTEDVMFFTSNRDGGKGGRDIYMVKRLPDLTWALPVNLEAINTPYDEDSPFIHPNGKTLYFSSNSPASMGGFDIFISEYDEKTDTWSEPKNLGYPINTAGDDIYFVWSLDGERGYFSSERSDSYGDKDIYMVIFPAQRMNPIVLKGVVTDFISNEPLGSLIEVVDNETQAIVAVANSNDLNGKYSLILPPNKNYGVRYIRDGYLFKSLNINIPNQFEYLEIVENVALKPIAPNQFEDLNNIFFAEDMGLRYESESESKELMEFRQRLPKEYALEVVVHSDNAEDSVLSIFKTQAKADAVTSKMFELHGAPMDGVVPKGMGPRFPAFSNETPRGRKMNNRIEYVLRTGDGSEEELANQRQEGMGAQEPVQIITQTNIGIDTISSLNYKLKVGDLLVIKHKISFKTASSVLNASSHPALDEVAAFLLDHPSIVVEVAGHTDNQGTDEFNRQLGMRRASVVAQQLVYRGVPESMLKVVSYGESRPIATNETEAGRAKNRRTEFKVISAGDSGGVLPTDD